MRLSVFAVSRIVVHQDFHVDQNGLLFDDVALVQLGNVLLESSVVNAPSMPTSVCLPDKKLLSDDVVPNTAGDEDATSRLKTTQCYVIGWGVTSLTAGCELCATTFM